MVLFGNDEWIFNGYYVVYYVFLMEGVEKCWIVVKALVDVDSWEFLLVILCVFVVVWGE